MTKKEYHEIIELKQKLWEVEKDVESAENMWEHWSRSNNREVHLKGSRNHQGWKKSIYVPPKLIEMFLSENLIKAQSKYNAIKRKFDNLKLVKS